MAKSCLNIGENLFSGYICVYFQGKDSRLSEKEPGNNLQPTNQETQLVRFQFPELGQDRRSNQIQDLHLRPKCSVEGQALLKNSVSPTVNWTSVKFFTSNRWKPHGKRKNKKKTRVGMLMALLPQKFTDTPLLGLSEVSFFCYHHHHHYYYCFHSFLSSTLVHI